MSVTLGMILSGNVDHDDDDGPNKRSSGESSMMMPVLDQPKMAPQHRPNNKYMYIVAQDPPTNQKEEKDDDDNIRPILIQRQEQQRQDRVEDFYRQHPLLQAYRRPRRQRQRQPTPEGEDCGNFHIHCPPDRIPRDSPAPGHLVIHDVTQMEDDHDDDDDDSFSQTSSSNSSLSSDSHEQQQQQQTALANVDLPSLPPLNAEKTVQDCQVVGKQATSMLLGRQHQYHPASRRPSSGETIKQHPDYTVPSQHFESPTSAVHFPDLLAPAKEVQTSSSLPPIPPRHRRPRIQRPHGAAAAALADRLSSLSTTHPPHAISSNTVETKDGRPRQESFTLQAELPQTKSQQERVVVLPTKSTEQNANDWWTTTTACFSCTTSPSQTSPKIETPSKPKQVTTTFLAPVALPAAMALTTTTTSNPVQKPSPLSVIAEPKAKPHAPPIPERSSNNNRRAIVPRPRTPARRKTRSSSSSKLSKKQEKQQQQVEEEPERVERKSSKDDQPTIHGSAQDQNPMRNEEELRPNGSNISPFPHFFDLPESDQDLLAHLVPQATVLPPPPPVAKKHERDFLKLPSLSFPNNKEEGGPPYQELRIWSKTESDNDDNDDSSTSSPLFPIAEVVVPPSKKQGTRHQNTIRTSTSFPVPMTRPASPHEHRKEQSMPHQRTVSFPLYLQQKEKEDDPIVRARQHPRQEDDNEDSTIPPSLPVRRVANVTSRMDQIREVLDDHLHEELETTPMEMVGDHDQSTRNLEYYLSKLSQPPPRPAAAPVVVPSTREDSTVQPTPTSTKVPPLDRQHSKDEKPPTPVPMERLAPVVEKPAVKSSPSLPLGPIEKNVPSQFHAHTSTTGECFGCLSNLLVFVFCCGGSDEQESESRPRTDTLETVDDAPTQDDTWMAATDGGGPYPQQDVSSPPPQELLLPVPQQRQVRQVFSSNNAGINRNVPPLSQHQQNDPDDDETCVSSHFASKYEYSLASHPHYPSPPRSFQRRRQVHFDIMDDNTELKRNDWYDTEQEGDDDLESMPSMGDATRAAYMHSVVFGPAPSSCKTPDQQEREFVQTLFEPLPEEPFLSRIFC